MESHNVLDRISLAGRTKCTKVIHLGRVLSWFHGKMSPFSKNAIWGSPTNTHTQKPITKTEVFWTNFPPPFFQERQVRKTVGIIPVSVCVFFVVHLWEGRELWRFGGWGLRFQRWFACVTKTSEFSGRWWRNAEVSRDGKKICKS